MRQDSSPNKNGQLLQIDFPDNTGGTNLADSVFKISQTQAAGGYNFDYILTGGIQKRLGPVKINSSADTQLRSLGLGLYAPGSGSTKTPLRGAGTKLQAVDTSALTFAALTQDNLAASSTPFTAGSTQTVNFNQFNSGTSDILWAVGGGATLPIGAYSTTKYTSNGVAIPTGSLGSPTANAHDSGSWSVIGTYYYSIVYRKTSTQALSNAVLDVAVTIVNTDDTVTISFAGLTGLDTTLIDKIYVYRSAVGGTTAFTTGNLVAKVNSNAASFKDLGNLGNPDLLLVQNIPRAGNTVLDNSVLPAATYNVCTLFKRRLVTASGNTLYLSDLNKSESWPTTNYITVPSGGNVTALAVISFTSPQAQTLDEILVVFKEREVWVVTGTAYTDWSLKFIDAVGCPSQSLIALANGFLAWIDFRGIYLWDGTSKPIYCSRLLEPLFAYGGDLDKTKLNMGVGRFLRRENQILWYLSSKTFGEQQYAIKLDLRLTMPQIQQNLTGRNIDAVLIQDNYAFPVYAALSYIPLNGAQEQLMLGDSSGYVYFASNGYSDGGANYSFTYKTPPLHMGDPNTEKVFHKVIAWVQDIGDWNLILDYWSGYKTAEVFKATQSQPISTSPQSAGLWDIAFWDIADWDNYNPDVVPLIFNLQSSTVNSNQGTAIQLQFRNDTASEPIVIHGFSVIYSTLGGITA